MKQITLNELKTIDLKKLKRVDLAGLIYDLDTLYLNQKRKCNKNEWVKRSLNGVGSAKGWLKAELIEIVSRKIIEALEMNNTEKAEVSQENSTIVKEGLTELNINLKAKVESVQDEELKELLNGDDSFRYMMLDRLLSDCRYYLGYGNRCTSNLWAKDENKQIKYIKALYNSFDNNNKPSFISMEDINQFEKGMCDKEYIKSMLQEKLNKISLEYDKNNLMINQHIINYEEYEATERRLKYQYNNIEQQIKNL